MDGNSNTSVLYRGYNHHHSNINISFTLDYAQQVLYWIRYDSCTLESASSVDGSQRRSYSGYDQAYCYTVAVDFFQGAIYSYSIHHKRIAKTMLPSVNGPLTISYYNHISSHMCSSYPLYRKLKVISYQRQKQGTLN